MRPQKLLPVLLGNFCFYISCIVGDTGPYFRSSEYAESELGRWPYQTYYSSHAIGPILNIQQQDSACDDNNTYILLTPWGSEARQGGPMILDQRGNLVWNDPSFGRTWALDVKIFNGEPYLTFWADKGLGNYNGSWYMLNSSYHEVHTIRSGGGWRCDSHDFEITPEQTALFTTDVVVPLDLTPVGGPRDGWVLDTGFQEIAIKTGRVLFQWSPSEHWDLTESYRELSGGKGVYKEAPFDFFHLNSVQKDLQGNYLISSRHTSTVAYIDGRTGNVLWKLGGKQNMFSDLSGDATNFNGQHHARFLKGSGGASTSARISVFDNGSGGQALTHSASGKIIHLDFQRRSALTEQRYQNNNRPAKIPARGSAQILPSGHVLVGYGTTAAWSEFSPNGTLLCDAHFGPESRFDQDDVFSYRVLKQPWSGLPKERPSLAVVDDRVYVSWNGATEVVAWRLQGTNGDAENFVFFSLNMTQKVGFESEVWVPKGSSYRYLQVIGLNRHGETLGSTRITESHPLDIGISNWWFDYHHFWVNI